MMTRRPALAVSLYVEGKSCVVVGDGLAADERVTRLRDAGAIVELVRSADYHAGLLAGRALVFACDAATAEEVTRDARAAGAMAYALDRPELSDLAMPALARRGPLTIAIATDGVAPALSRRVRDELARLLAESGAELDALIAELERLRDHAPAGDVRRDALWRMVARLSIEGKVVVKLE